ncbi:MAG: hypothetical protein ACLFTK_06295 [Anaerolineales bacterium]
MTTNAEQTERLTWLSYELEQRIERFLHGDIDARALADQVASMTSYDEVDNLADPLVMHTFWAAQHMQHRPACWAPTREELEYLLLCLRGEEVFDPEQLDFTYQNTPRQGAQNDC